MSHIETLEFLSPGEAYAVAESYGRIAPSYAYDETILHSRAEDALAMPVAFGNLTVRYAMKANPNPYILQLFRAKGIKIDASSEFEVDDAIKAGFNPDEISISSQRFPEDPSIFDDGVDFNACSLHQLEEYGRRFPGTAIGVRFNPGMGSGDFKKTTVGGPVSSFGIWHEYIGDVQELARRYNLTIERVHTHIGSGNKPAIWTHAAEATLGIVEQFPAATTLDLGGGFKVARMSYEEATDLKMVGGVVQRSFEDFAERTGREINMEIEPGTFLTANAGAIVAKVVDKKDTGVSGHNFLIVNTGMAENLRFALYGAQHPLVVVNDQPLRVSEYVVSGHNCESSDVLTTAPGKPDEITERPMQTARIGDLMVIEGCGAYCASMGARTLHRDRGYNSYPYAAEVLKKLDGTFEDISIQK